MEISCRCSPTRQSGFRYLLNVSGAPSSFTGFGCGDATASVEGLVRLRRAIESVLFGHILVVVVEGPADSGRPMGLRVSFTRAPMPGRR